MKISGWIRLWIVLSFLWIVPGLLVTFFTHQGESKTLFYVMTFAPPVLLYLAGLTTRWVYRGFSAS